MHNFAVPTSSTNPSTTATHNPAATSNLPGKITHFMIFGGLMLNGSGSDIYVKAMTWQNNGIFQTDQQCNTTSGHPCVIPFNMDGVLYNGCTNFSDPDGLFWCSTRTNNEGFHVQGNWGYCNEQELESGVCPRHGSEKHS